jgi:hypothetical protein
MHQLLHLDIRKLNYFGPLVDFVGKEFAEITGRLCKWRAA